MTLRFRLILWFTGTLTVILLIFCGALIWLQPQVDIATLDEELSNDIVTVSGVLATEVAEVGPGAQAVADMLEELKLPQRGIAVFDRSGHLLGAQWNGLEAGEAMGTPVSSGAWTYSASTGDARMRVGEITVAGRPYRVAIAASLDEVIHEGWMLRRAVIVAVPLALLLAALGGAIAATRALGPVRRMADEAAAITVTDAKRLTIVNPRDEMGTLARAFNDLIDRLNDAIDQQRRFMADASHELRTPVSVVRTAADVTLGRDARTEAEYRESFRIVGEQARRLSGLVEDMFLLARVDAGQRQIVATDFYFDEIVTECVRSTQVLADARHVTIVSDIAADVSYSGDEALARQLVANLLGNAVRHAPPGGRVWVSLTVAGSLLRLSVADDGAGVRPEDRERIFERFVKLDPTRNADGGAGLGLSIARWVAEAHGGTLTLSDAIAGRTTFEARFPYAHPAG
jgi:two-component system, OmpR family, sensor kinase